MKLGILLRSGLCWHHHHNRTYKQGVLEVLLHIRVPCWQTHSHHHKDHAVPWTLCSHHYCCFDSISICQWCCNWALSYLLPAQSSLQCLPQAEMREYFSEFNYLTHRHGISHYLYATRIKQCICSWTNSFPHEKWRFWKRGFEVCLCQRARQFVLCQWDVQGYPQLENDTLL